MKKLQNTKSCESKQFEDSQNFSYIKCFIHNKNKLIDIKYENIEDEFDLTKQFISFHVNLVKGIAGIQSTKSRKLASQIRDNENVATTALKIHLGSR